MAEFDIQQIEPQAKTTEVTGDSLTNIKQMRIGGGRWIQDSTALRMYDSDGKCVIYLGE